MGTAFRRYSASQISGWAGGHLSLHVEMIQEEEAVGARGGWFMSGPHVRTCLWLAREVTHGERIARGSGTLPAE